MPARPSGARRVVLEGDRVTVKLSETPPEEGVIANGGLVDARTIQMIVVPPSSPEKHVSNCP